MKKFFFFLVAGILIATLNSCGDDCDPGALPTDDNLNIIILNPNGTSFTKYPGNGLPDSVRVTNLATNALVNRYLISDSILVIEDFPKTNNSTLRFRIAKGTFLKADTVEVSIAKKNVQDACARDFEVARFTQIKFNNTVVCTNCAANTAYAYQR